MSAADARRANAELAGLVRAWRHRLSRGTLPGPQLRRRRHGRVTQEEIADAIGVSVVWYSNLERGINANYSAAFLDAVAEALQLSPEEQELLFLLTIGHAPAAAGAPADDATDRNLEQLVAGQRWPTYVLAGYADVVVHNDACESFYPWLRSDSNYHRWLFGSADARRRLVNWETDWAAPLLAEMRVARARYPEDERIATLVDDCLSADADVRRLWETHAQHLGPVPSRRGIRRSGDENATVVEVVTLADVRSSQLQVVSLLPAPDGDPETLTEPPPDGR